MISRQIRHRMAPRAPLSQVTQRAGLFLNKNPQALLAYYIGLLSLLPVLGLGMAPTALILGVKGLKYARQNPIVKGQAHAWIGIVCGGFWSLVHWGIAIALLISLVIGNVGNSSR